MAEKRYTAIFDAQDKVTPAVKRMEQSVKRARDEKGRFIKAVDAADKAQDRFTRSTRENTTTLMRMERALKLTGAGFRGLGDAGRRSVGLMVNGLSRLTNMLTSLPTLIASAGAAWGLWKVGDAVIGGALQQEMNETQLMGLAGSDQTGGALYDMIKAEAMNSTFATGEFMAAAKSYMGFTRDPEEMKGYLELTKRLALFDPVQGTEGAAVAIKEALSGDPMSLSERFEMPRSMLYANGFDSRADAQTNFEAVMKTIEAQGLTSDAVKKFESTGTGQLQQFRSKTGDWLGQMGRDAVEEMKPFFTELNKFFSTGDASRFATEMSQKLGGFFATASDELSKITWADIELGLTNTGRLLQTIGETGLTVMDAMTGGKGGTPAEIFQNFTESIGNMADRVDNFNRSLKDMFAWMEDSGFNGFMNGVTGFLSGNVEDGRRKGIAGWIHGGITEGDWSTRRSIDGSHRNGLSHVPYNGYIAELHQGEAVLTKEQNQAGFGGTSVVVNIQNANMNSKDDIDALGWTIVQKLQMRG